MKKYPIATTLNELKSGSTLVAVDIMSTNSQVVGFDSEEELVDLIHRITNESIFEDAYRKRLRGTLGDHLAQIVTEIEQICDKNKINLSKFLEMRKRFRSIESE